jgi:hypothetical protein
VRRLVAEVIAELAPITSFSPCWRILRSKSCWACACSKLARPLSRSIAKPWALGLGSGTDAPALPMRAVPKKPTFRDVAKKDRFRMTPAAKKVLEEAVRPNRRKLQVTAQQVLAQILTLQPPDPAAVLLGALGVNTSEVRRRLDAVTPDS